jgi:hypothetical protein
MPSKNFVYKVDYSDISKVIPDCKEIIWFFLLFVFSIVKLVFYKQIKQFPIIRGGSDTPRRGRGNILF